MKQPNSGDVLAFPSNRVAGGSDGKALTGPRPSPLWLEQGVPSGVAELVMRHLDVIASMGGFLDRIDYAAQTVRDLHSLHFAQVISEPQFLAMAGGVRELLQADLGSLDSAVPVG